MNQMLERIENHEDAQFFLLSKFFKNRLKVIVNKLSKRRDYVYLFSFQA